MRTKRARGAIISILAALLAAVVVAACGSASGATATGGSSGAKSSSRTQLASCLKQHGVTLPTGFGKRRPGGTPPAGGTGSGGTPPAGGAQGKHPGGGFFFGGGHGGTANRATFKKMQAALKACGAKFGSGHGFARPGAGGRFKPTAAAVKTFSACVAKHGYQLPAANLSGQGAIYPKKIEANSKFKAAAKACAADLRPSGAPGGGAPPSGSA